MSPYMKAYQAGIKLAEHEFFSKIADQENIPTEAYSDETLAEMGERASRLGGLLNDPSVAEEGKPALEQAHARLVQQMQERAIREAQQQAEQQAPTPQQQAPAPAPAAQQQAQQPESNYFSEALNNLTNYIRPTYDAFNDMAYEAREPVMQAVDQAVDVASPYVTSVTDMYSDISNMFSGEDAPTSEAQSAPSQFGAPSMTRGQSNLFNTQLAGIDPSLVAFGNRPQAAPSAPAQQPAAQPAARSLMVDPTMQGILPNFSGSQPVQTPLAPQETTGAGTLARGNRGQSFPFAGSNNPPMSPGVQQTATPADQGTRPSPFATPNDNTQNLVTRAQSGPRFDYQAVNQDGMADPDARFNVQAGNYRKQFDRFRQQFGGGREGAFSGLTYRDFAGALGNRGLRVGDSLNANDVMSRLQGIRQDNFNRQQGMPVASSGAGLPQLGIQNRRGRDVNRGSLSNMQQGIRNRAANRPAPGGLKMKQMSSPMTSGGSNRLPGPSNDFPY